MKKYFLAVHILLLAAPFSTAFAQSRRVSPSATTDKANQRAAKPSPTPAIPAEPGMDADDGPVINVDTRLVTIPVRVLDRKNRFVGGLTQSDFKVFDENMEQEIAYFTNEEQPFTVALVLDMSYSTTFKIGEIQSAAISFIDQLRPEDKVLVISFDEVVHMLTEATSDRRLIYSAINRTRISTGTSLYEAVDLTINDRLRSIRGRKSMVLFTDGVDTTSRASNDLENLRDATELDALIYPIRYDTFADVQSMKNKPVIDPPGSGRSTTPTTFPQGKTVQFPMPSPVVGTPGDKGTTAKEYADAEEYLNQLALRTGGRLHLAATVGSLNSAFAKIASELREFYSLGFYPKEEGKPGKTRRVKVRVSQPQSVVSARDSYVIPKARKKVRSY